MSEKIANADMIASVSGISVNSGAMIGNFLKRLVNESEQSVGRQIFPGRRPVRDGHGKLSSGNIEFHSDSHKTAFSSQMLTNTCINLPEVYTV